MTTIKTTSCYACENPSTSYEHIPPESFFRGISYVDKNLLKVPSCDQHNNQKTNLDEYFRNLFSCCINSNINGLSLFINKTYKSFIASPTKKQNFLKNAKPVLYGGINTGSIELDNSLVQEYFSLMAYGLYYYEFNKRYESQFHVFPITFEPQSAEVLAIRYFDSKLGLGLAKNGTYPEVFYYQILTDGEKFLGFRMVFFEGIVFLIASSDPLSW